VGTKINYKSSGVDIDKADRLVFWIKKQDSWATKIKGSDYASLFPLSFKQYKDPVIASSTDGIGTKVKLANHFSSFESLGQDLVAMCVNDLICVGAKPLFFLDYYACGHLDLPSAKKFFKGLLKSCKEASCQLIGGETAELPGLYQKGDIDCAGFAVGLVEKQNILGPHLVKAGDEVLALASSGFHSNGYSLLRKIYSTPSALYQNKKELIKPTRLYTFLSPYLNQIPGLKSIAHITGGGIQNISRIIPKGLFLSIEPWLVPKPFLDVKKRAQLPWNSLLKTLNCGLGLVLILSDSKEFLKLNLIPKKEIIFLGRITKSKNSSSRRWQINTKAMKQKNNV